MQIRCPWCRETFESDRYGKQFCIRCGAELDVPEPAQQERERALHEHGLPPPGGWHHQGARAETEHLPPWERRKELGFFPALVQTWVEATLRPTEFFSKLAPGGGIGPAFGYAVIVGSIGSIFSSLWMRLYEGALGFPQGGVHAPLGLQLIGVPFAIAVGLFIGAAILHVGCMVFGCASRGFDTTFRVLSYSVGPLILGVLPFCGSFAGFVWTVVLVVIGVTHVQQTTTGRAVGAVILPLLLPIACACALALFLGMGAALIGAQL